MTSKVRVGPNYKYRRSGIVFTHTREQAIVKASGYSHVHESTIIFSLNRILGFVLSKTTGLGKTHTGY